MLQLTLIRHAKSDWGDPNLKDIDRPLNTRGLQDAPLMSDILNEKLAIFDQLISSPAKRAITTSKAISGKTGASRKRH